MIKRGALLDQAKCPWVASWPPTASTERGKQGTAVERNVPSSGRLQSPAVSNSGSPHCAYALTHGELSDLLGVQPCTRLAAEGPVHPMGGRAPTVLPRPAAAAKTSCLPMLPALPTWPRSRWSLSVLQSRSLVAWW